jgi:hypothetical protein
VKYFPEGRGSKDKDLSKHTKLIKAPENIDYSPDLSEKNDANNLKKLSNGTPTSSLPIPTFSLDHNISTGRNPYYM